MSEETIGITEIHPFPNLQDDQHKVFTFVVLLISWCSLYAIVHLSYTSVKLKRKTLLDTRNRIISIVHGVGSFVMACMTFFTNHFKYFYSDSVSQIAHS